MPQFDPSQLPFAQTDMFAPSSSLPGAPSMGGFMPSQYEMMMNMMQRQSGNALASYVLANDPRALAASGMLAGAFGGQNSQSWLKTDTGKMVNMGVSALINSGTLFNAGGNNVDLAFGLQNVVGQGMTASGPGGNQFFSGKGFANDMVSKQFYNQVTKDFYGVAGTSNLNRTQGFDRSQIGTVFTEMGRRGMGLGLTGKLRNVTEADFADELAGASTDKEREKIQAEIKTKIASGKKTFEIDEATSKKFRDQASSALKTVRLLADITGSTDVAQLMRESEQITGNSYAEQGGADMIRTKIANLNRTATDLGMNPQSMLSMVSQLGGGQQAMQAVVDSANQFKTYQKDREAALAAGEYIPEADQGQTAAINAGGRRQITNERPDIAAAIYVMQNNPAAKGREAEIKKHIEAITHANSKEAKDNARQELNTYMSDITGGLSLNTVAQQHGGVAGLESAYSGASKDYAAGIARDEDISRTVEWQIPNLVKSINLGKAYNLDTDKLVPIVHDMFGKMDSDQRRAMMAAMKKGDVSGVTKAIDASLGFNDKEREMFSKNITDAMSTKGANLYGALTQATNEIDSRPGMRTIIGLDDGDRQVASRRATKAWLDENSFGQAPAPGNFATQVLRGAVGASNNDDSVVLNYMALIKSNDLQQVKLQKNEKGEVVANLNDAEAGGLLKKNAKLAEAMGIDPNAPDAANKLSQAMATVDGMDKFRNFLESNGYKKAVDSSQIRLATPEAADPLQNKEAKKVDTKALALVAGTRSDHGELTKKVWVMPTKGKHARGGHFEQVKLTAAEIGQAEAANQAKMLAGLEDPDSLMSKAVERVYRSDPNQVTNMLDKDMSDRKAAHDAYAKRGILKSIGIGYLQALTLGVVGDDTKKKAGEYDVAKQEKEKLTGKTDSTSANNDLVGTIKLIISDGVLMDVAHARNLK
jgi:hypothetical protein